MLWIFHCLYFLHGVTLWEPEMAVTKNSKEKKTMAPAKRASEAAEGAGGFRILLIDHKGADI